MILRKKTFTIEDVVKAHITILIAALLALISYVSCQLCAERWTSTNDDALVSRREFLTFEHQLEVSSTFSIMDCDEKCQGIASCLVYSYSRSTSTCVLYSKEPQLGPGIVENVRTLPRSYYQKANTCPESRCVNGTTCSSECDVTGHLICTCADGFYGAHCINRDGSWSEWSPWSDCIPQMNSPAWQCVGSQTRWRACTDPPPEGDGEPCNGNNTTKQYCIPENETCPNTCDEILSMGASTSGVYGIKTCMTGNFLVYCDFSNDEEGWVVIQRRYDGSVDFNRSRQDYAEGFGLVTEEFWLGNDYISALTECDEGNGNLFIELEDWNGSTGYVLYYDFHVADVELDYELGDTLWRIDSDMTLPLYRVDPLEEQVARKFSSARELPSCAGYYNGGWWFIADGEGECAFSNLNGKYIHVDRGEQPVATEGIIWSYWNDGPLSLKATQMKVR
ncbi:ryncolin-1-like [Ptychodera flava]|uniref:ryncolin-1-like n=1 Tax=Ptychodera flava TaxID=63121 RepID=UPI00396A7E9D